MGNEVKIGLIGYGTVGKGTVEVLKDNIESITDKTGLKLTVKSIADLRVKDINDDGYFENVPVHTVSVDDILNDDEISIVVELIGGYEPAKSFIIKAMEKGKHVVTANKALLAVHGPEIFKCAEENNVSIGFEGAVGGGIPIVRVLKEDLAGNQIKEITGIINGTANYILTKMEEEGKEFYEVLQEAQELGYAEADPTFDVEGVDTAHKIAILASMAFDTLVPFEKIFVRGISSIKQVDIAFAAQLGCRIKLLAIAKKHENEIEIRVHPTIVPKDNIMAQVGDVFNAIEVIGNKVDRVVNVGRGAGANPTGSAVVGDIISIARDISANCQSRVPSLGFSKEYTYYYPVKDITDIESAFYLRFSVSDEPGSLAKIASILSKYQISISQALQRDEQMPNKAVPLVFLTHKTNGKNIRSAIEEINNIDVCQDKAVVIRVRGLS